MYNWTNVVLIYLSEKT